jgi:hypothetical protein
MRKVWYDHVSWTHAFPLLIRETVFSNWTVTGPVSSYTRQPFFSVPVPVSSYTRQCFLLYQVQCRATLESAFCCTRSNSSYTRKCFLLYQVRCRATLDSRFCCTRSNSSYTRQCFMLYQVRCRVTLDSAFCCTRYSVELHSKMLSGAPGRSVELHSTLLSAVQSPMSTSNRHVVWCTIFYVLLSSCDLMAAFEIRILRDFLEKFWPGARN